jgi:hypothetical protein
MRSACAASSPSGLLDPPLRIDADGAALAAIQGLYLELKDHDVKIATLEARLTELEQVLKQIAAG